MCNAFGKKKISHWYLYHLLHSKFFTIFNPLLGVLKLVQTFLNFIGTILCFPSKNFENEDGTIFEFISLVGFLIDVVLLILEMTKLTTKTFKLMQFLELFLNAIFIILYSINLSLIIERKHSGIFKKAFLLVGFLANLTYFCDSVLLIKRSIDGRIPEIIWLIYISLEKICFTKWIQKRSLKFHSIF